MQKYEQSGLIDLLKDFPEGRVFKLLSSFSCPKSKDVESFMRNSAIDFEKKSTARTYFAHVGDDIAGAFSLTGKSLLMPGEFRISATLATKIKKFSDEHESIKVWVINAILIGQLGKNQRFKGEPIAGRQLLELAYTKISEARRIIGGKLVYIECEDEPKLIEFYITNGFARLQNRDKHKSTGYLVQMIKYI
jgi:hypothetical protein